MMALVYHQIQKPAQCRLLIIHFLVFLFSFSLLLFLYFFFSIVPF